MYESIKFCHLEHVEMIKQTELTDYLDKIINDKRFYFIILLTRNLFVKSVFNKRLRAIIQKSDMVLPYDFKILKGIKVVYPKYNVITYLHENFLVNLFNQYEKTNKTFFLLGGNDFSNKKAVKNIKVSYGDINIVGSHSIRQLKSIENEITEKVRKTEPTFFLLGMGEGKEERWIDGYRTKFSKSICVGIKDEINIFGEKLPSAFSGIAKSFVNSISYNLMLFLFKMFGSKRTRKKETEYFQEKDEHKGESSTE